MTSTNRGIPGPGNNSEDPGQPRPKSENWPDTPVRRGVEDTADPAESSRTRQMQHSDESDVRPIQDRGSAQTGEIEQRGLPEDVEGSDYE